MRRLAHLTYPVGRKPVNYEQLVIYTILPLHLGWVFSTGNFVCNIFVNFYLAFFISRE
jgi:hypothetical protein